MINEVVVEPQSTQSSQRRDLMEPQSGFDLHSTISSVFKELIPNTLYLIPFSVLSVCSVVYKGMICVF